MTQQLEAMRLALEALEYFSDTATLNMDKAFSEDAITAIKEALAQPEQEPDDLTIAYMAGLSRGEELAHQNVGGVLFAVEEAIRNGDCPWQIEQAFDEYETERKASHGIKGEA